MINIKTMNKHNSEEELIKRVLINRGYDIEIIDALLNVGYSQELPMYNDLTNVNVGADIIESHIANGSNIFIFGDYDSDGVNSSYILSDAINQMHRYRDAIYYNEVANAPMPKDLKKEIVGGYVLFPGSGGRIDVERQKFYESIAQVNIGAFPLRPETGNESRELLVEFIRNLIQSSASQLVNEEKKQKSFIVDMVNGKRL